LRLRFASWLALILHLLAGLAMALILRQGLETAADQSQRFAFLAEYTALWVGAWLLWNLAALSIVYYYAAFAWAHEANDASSRRPLQLAVWYSLAGLALDYAAEGIEMGVLPGLARQALSEPGDDSPAAKLFLTLHRTAVMLTGCMANGLYTLSALLLVCFTRAEYPRWVWSAGLGVSVAGFALSAAALADSPEGMVTSNAVLVPCIVTWQVGVALGASKRAQGV
jgi:hypothetical protein